VDQSVEQLETDIRHARTRLGAGFDELEDRVQAVTDWRRHYRQNAWPVLGLAFAGGVVLSIMSRNASPPSDAARFEAGRGESARQILDIWKDVQRAMIAVGAARITDYIADLVPGFRDELSRTGRR
jgi:hypothetical protein